MQKEEASGMYARPNSPPPTQIYAYEGKTQCDLRARGCSQCERAKLQCHGYRDPKDLAFRDETRATERKVLARQAAAAPAGLDHGWEVHSRHVFFGVYLDGLSRSCEALGPLYAKASATQPLAASVDAVSLAFTSFQNHSPLLMRRANEKYIIAIRKLNESLRDIPVSTSDETLQTVVLLDMYEKMVNRNPHSQASWMSHIRGALSLIQARMDRQDLSLFASQLARRVVIAMTISCGAAGILVPDTISVLRRKLDISSTLDAKWGFTALLVDAVNLRAQLHTTGRELPGSIAEAARAIEGHLVDLENALPPSWKPRRIYTVGHDPCVLGQYYDLYPDHFIIQTWNAIRIIRLEMIGIVKTHGPADTTRSVSSNLIDEIAQKICASVPQVVLPGVCQDSRQYFSPLQTLQCCTLLTPLYLAAQMSSNMYLKEWIIRSLYHMATAGNMMIAKEVADILRRKPEVSHWTIYTMVGSYAIAG